MKTVTRYMSEDGKIFERELACVEYEILIKAINEIASRLPCRPKDDSRNFSNGEGYLQHDSDVVNKAMIDLLKLSGLCEEIQKKPEFIKSPFAYRNSIIGRYIDDSNSPIRSLWWRFSGNCLKQKKKKILESQNIRQSLNNEL